MTGLADVKGGKRIGAVTDDRHAVALKNFDSAGEVNDALGDSPETINEDPYGAGWLVKVKLSDPSEQEALLDAAGYAATLS